MEPKEEVGAVKLTFQLISSRTYILFSNFSTLRMPANIAFIYNISRVAGQSHPNERENY